MVLSPFVWLVKGQTEGTHGNFPQQLQAMGSLGPEKGWFGAAFIHEGSKEDSGSGAVGSRYHLFFWVPSLGWFKGKPSARQFETRPVAKPTMSGFGLVQKGSQKDCGARPFESS